MQVLPNICVHKKFCAIKGAFQFGDNFAISKVISISFNFKESELSSPEIRPRYWKVYNQKNKKEHIDVKNVQLLNSAAYVIKSFIQDASNVYDRFSDAIALEDS